MSRCLPKSIQELQQSFVRERRYLKNVTPKTVTWYETSFRTFSPFLDRITEEGA